MPAPECDPIDARLQACLDARRDPLDDADLCELLADNPARLEAFSRLHAALRSLPQQLLPRRHARWPIAVVTAVAAAALVTILVLAQREPPALPRILSAHLEETAPRAWIAADVTTRERLLTTTDSRLETYQRWSSRR